MHPTDLRPESLVHRPSLSIVTTLFKSEEFVDEFVSRSLSVGAAYKNLEIVLVDDGSPDNSLAVAIALSNTHSSIKVVELSRNFGHHKAILAGLSIASGDLVFFSDSDLEEPPELLTEFQRVMDATDSDVVFGINPQSEGSIVRRASSVMFWRMFRLFGDSKAPTNICNVRLMRRDYVNALCELPEKDVFLGGLFHWVGFKQIGVPIKRSITRQQSTYSFVNRLTLGIRSIVAFSNAPLRAMFWLGMAISLVSTFVAAVFFARRLQNPDIPVGFTALIVSVWFLGGTIIACLGVIGMYISYIFAETKARPRTLIRRIYGADK